MKMTRSILMAVFIVFVSAKAMAFNGNHKQINDTIANQVKNGEFTVKVNGLKIWYKVSGKGPVCIFPTPGWGPSSDMYFNSLKELEDTFTMIYIDTRGSGRSEKPELEKYTTENFISDIDGVRKDIGVEKVWLMGHSKGGALVLQYAYNYKDHAKGLILLDASMGVNMPNEKRQKIVISKQNEPWFQKASGYFSREPKDEEDWKTGIQAVTPMFFYSTEGFEKSKEIIKTSSLSYHAFQGQKYWWDCETKMLPKLKDIQVPTLIVVGQGDFICGLYTSEYAHRKIPNSKLLVIEEAGHFPWMEQPKEFFTGLKEFLPHLGY